MTTQKVVLDTDIGDDIDDAYALALMLASAEIELLGVTTVFENVAARARQAKTILKLAGREQVPVAAGCGMVMSPRITYREADLPQGQTSLTESARPLLEDRRPRQDSTALPFTELPPMCESHGVDFLIDTIMTGDADIIPVTIGAMTNLAMALIKEPRIMIKIPRIVSMAGAFDRPKAEWNIACDPLAAAVVFNSRIPLTLVPLDVTTKCVLDRAQLDELAARDRPIAQNLSAATKAWADRLPTLHDPLAVETLIRPDIVKTRNGTVTVDLTGEESYGCTLFAESEQRSGPHDVCFGVKANEACELWLERVLSL